MNSLPESFAVDMLEESRANSVTAFANHHEYLEMEFHKLDVLLNIYTRSFRKRMSQMNKLATSSEVYISDAEIDFLLGNTLEKSETLDSNDELFAKQEKLDELIKLRLDLTFKVGRQLALPRLCQIFKLSNYELQLILLCLAPELDAKYDTIFAYLQDDIARKRPSLDLALNLFAQQGVNKWTLRSFINENSPVFRSGLIHLLDDVNSPSGNSSLAKLLKLDERILDYLVENTHADSVLATGLSKQLPQHSFSAVAATESICLELQKIVDHHLHSSASTRQNLIINLYGKQFAEQLELVHAVCAHIDTPFLQMDFSQLSDEQSLRQKQIRNCLKEGLLQQCPLLSINKIDQEFFYQAVEEYGWLTFVLSEKPCLNEQALRYHKIASTTLFVPTIDSSRQRSQWRHYNNVYKAGLDEKLIHYISNHFNLNSLQIDSLVKSLALHSRIYACEVDIKLVEQMCRSESNQDLCELAEKVSTRYSWQDIVLPQRINEYLRTICNQVKCQFKVFDEWGFAQKSNFGKGISALFSGPPGTGKTMAAQIVANELGLDLYKINLANVVSKYIGETEKNLEKIFRAAEFSNAILLFDECDAIFGKRTEVSDSHDRYANIEVSFLLQKMEEYRGIVLLTTNLKKNIDEAFVRRIRFILEFPFPDKGSREEIWRCHFPSEAPLAEDVCFADLAEKFSVSGGNIKNIVLNAAFLAANSSEQITLEHVLESAKREYEKIGKLTYTFSQ